MNANGPIIIIEDDSEEAMILKELIQNISYARDIAIIGDSTKAINFLRDCERPFLVLSAINLRGLNGFQLRQLILSDKVLARKCMPYIFYSAHGNANMLSQVYDHQGDGYFHDINDYSELESRLSLIIQYWEKAAV